MSKGRIVADGKKEEILQVDGLRNLFGVAVEMARRNGHYTCGEKYSVISVRQRVRLEMFGLEAPWKSGASAPAKSDYELKPTRP